MILIIFTMLNCFINYRFGSFSIKWLLKHIDNAIISSFFDSKKILNNKVFYTESVDDYKIILVCDMTVESTTSSDKLTLLIADDSPVITKFFICIVHHHFYLHNICVI